MLEFAPNRSLDGYGADRFGEESFLPSFIFFVSTLFLVGFHPSFSRHGITRASSVLLIWLNENVRSQRSPYAFELATNHLLNNPMKAVQERMTDRIN